jgi:hypothetical protein
MVYRHHHHSIFMELPQHITIECDGHTIRAHQDAVCAHSQKLQPLSLSSVIEPQASGAYPFFSYVRDRHHGRQEKYLIPQKKKKCVHMVD